MRGWSSYDSSDTRKESERANSSKPASFLPFKTLVKDASPLPSCPKKSLCNISAGPPGPPFFSKGREHWALPLLHVLPAKEAGIFCDNFEVFLSFKSLSHIAVSHFLTTQDCLKLLWVTGGLCLHLGRPGSSAEATADSHGHRLSCSMAGMQLGGKQGCAQDEETFRETLVSFLCPTPKVPG